MKLVAQALAAAAILSATGAPLAAAPRCDRERAVEIVRDEAAREQLDLSNLQLAVEGPYGRAKFVRTHPTFHASPDVLRRIAKRTFYFVWFHPPFLRSVGARGADVWGLVDASRCELLHVERVR